MDFVAAGIVLGFSIYEYYKDKKVINFRKESDTVFYGSVKGTTTYDVKIDINHTVKNTYCNCPFAKDNRKICKHMVALYFTAFPNEAEQYIENKTVMKNKIKIYNLSLNNCLYISCFLLISLSIQ